MVGLFLKLQSVKALLALLASIAVVLPAGLLLLKWFALPLLLVLGIVGLPLLFVIAILGFPFFIVFGIVGVVLALLAAVVSFGLVALKIFLFVVLPIWLVFKVIGWLWRTIRGKPAAEPPAAATAGEGI